MIHPITTLPLSSRYRVSQILFHRTEPYLAVQSHERSIEIFRIRTEEEVRKKQARRRKRAKEKKGKDKSPENTLEGIKVEDNKAGDNEEIQLPDLFTPYLIVRSSGKIRSFDFGIDRALSKSGAQVREPAHIVRVQALMTRESFSWLYHQMRWRCTTSHDLQSLSENLSNQVACTLLTSLVTGRIFGR
jgi:hypothetical protein